MNTEETAIARINSFSPDDWEELLSLIPEIERTPTFGKFPSLALIYNQCPLNIIAAPNF